MRRLPLIVTFIMLVLGIVAGVFPRYAKNPDPNHTHADFAVWINGTKWDFSGDAYMSGASTDDATHDEEDEVHHPYLHLHDGNGHVIHRHKPGLMLGDFLLSLGVEFTEPTARNNFTDCLKFPGDASSYCKEEGNVWTLYVNGEQGDGVEKKQTPLMEAWYYDFHDGDSILLWYGKLSDAPDDALKAMTSDACLYSKTCPWRGDPPVENCIADPAVPCVE